MKISLSIYNIILIFFEVANLIHNIELINPTTDTGKKPIT